MSALWCVKCNVSTMILRQTHDNLTWCIREHASPHDGHVGYRGSGEVHLSGGRFYVIRREDANVRVGCLKRITLSVAEIQRMYVQPHVRGVGAGRLLLQQLLSGARAIGYEAVRLESLKFLSAAHALYKSVGFAEITPYAENSMTMYQPRYAMGRYRSSAVFMELRLWRERIAGDDPPLPAS